MIRVIIIPRYFYKNGINPILKLKQTFSDLEQWNIKEPKKVLLKTTKIGKDPEDYENNCLSKRLFDKDSNGKSSFSELDARIKTGVISAFSSFNTKESMDDYIYPLINDKNYYVSTRAIFSIGSITSQLSKDKKITLEEEKEKIGLLKSTIKKEHHGGEKHIIVRKQQEQQL